MSRRAAALLTAAALAWGLWAPPARAAASPVLAWEEGEGRGEILLALEGLDGSGVYAAQLDLALEGSWPSADFTAASRELYGVCQAEEDGDTTRLTLCLTSRNAPMGSGERLFLGTLDLGGRGSGEDVLPASADLILLGRGLNRIEAGRTDLRARSGVAGWGGGEADEDNRPSRPKPSRPAEPEEPEELEEPEEAIPGPVLSMPFLDVRETDWYYNAVRYVYAQSLMNGAAPDRFAPNEPTTRGMIVTILHRMEGSPEAPVPSFPDVRADFYYAQPIAWAEAQGIVTGYDDGTFAPENSITREQLAAILFRFARYRGWDTSASASLEMFQDAGRVQPYAAEPMAWAVGTGLMAGKGEGMLAPDGLATRAEVATILMRLEATVQTAP